MQIHILKDPVTLGKASAEKGSELIRKYLEEKDEVNIVLATGTSQFQTLTHLLKQDIDWTRVNIFHLDEYIGLEEEHPASFRKYIRERFVEKLPAIKSVHYINGDVEDPEEEIRRLNSIVSQHPIDVAFIGIGENGHIAFNDPPADFMVEEPFIKVKLDNECRNQQLGEGWFHSLDDVPSFAISMTVKQILRSKHIICSVPEKRKASAVKNSVECEVNNIYPASVLQEHAHCDLFLDEGSALLLQNS